MLRLELNMTFEEVLENLQMRDLSDSQRKHSPLIQVKDAILIDNTLLDINESLEFIKLKLNFCHANSSFLD